MYVTYSNRVEQRQNDWHTTYAIYPRIVIKVSTGKFSTNIHVV